MEDAQRSRRWPMRTSMSNLVLASIIMLSDEELGMFILWHAVDPVSQGDWGRDVGVKNVLGNGSSWVQ